MADDVLSGDDVIKSPAPNAPKYSKESWIQARLDYETGSFVSLKELADRHGINPITLRRRVISEKWLDRQSSLLSKVDRKVEKALVGQAEKYLEESFSVAKKYRRMIDASQEHNGAKASDGTPLLDPEALDVYSRTELRIHELAKSALRIVDSKNVDVTSGGMSIAENFTEAVKKLREVAASEALPELTDEEIERLKDCRIEGEDGQVG